MENKLKLHSDRDFVKNVCKKFPKHEKVKIFSTTSCECDTGPHADGYCALTVRRVSPVPAEFVKYLE